MNTDTNMALPSKIRWESYTMRELVEKDNMLILRESSKTKMGILFSFLFLIGYPIFTALEDVDFDLDMMIDSFQV